MNDDEALLAGILQQPDEDLPRLVYADFLDERGAPGDAARAEFIRVQCALSAEQDESRSHLQLREKLLLSTYYLNWLAPLRKKGEALQNPGTHGLFRRGFVEIVWMPAVIFLKKAEKLFARTPARELRVIRASRSELAELLQHPELARLQGLTLSDRRLGDAMMPLLLQSPAVISITSLSLCACGLTDAGAEMLKAMPESWQPRELDLSYNTLSKRTLASLRQRFGSAVRYENTRRCTEIRLAND